MEELTYLIQATILNELWLLQASRSSGLSALVKLCCVSYLVCSWWLDFCRLFWEDDSVPSCNSLLSHSPTWKSLWEFYGYKWSSNHSFISRGGIVYANHQWQIKNIDLFYNRKSKFFSKSLEALEARNACDGIIYWTQSKDEWFTVQAVF